jgi:hypothetical protein
MRIGFFMNYCPGGAFTELEILRTLFKTQIELFPSIASSIFNLLG